MDALQRSLAQSVQAALTTAFADMRGATVMQPHAQSLNMSACMRRTRFGTQVRLAAVSHLLCRRLIALVAASGVVLHPQQGCAATIML